MDAKFNFSPAEFAELAVTDTLKWVEHFCAQASEDDEELTISDLEDCALTYDVLGCTLKKVHSEGGCEGGGDHAEIVFGIMYNGACVQHFRVTGYYSSYDGTDWDDVIEVVFPREVLVTQYFTTKV